MSKIIYFDRINKLLRIHFVHYVQFFNFFTQFSFSLILKLATLLKKTDALLLFSWLLFNLLDLSFTPLLLKKYPY